jgi:hypothetical protein
MSGLNGAGGQWGEGIFENEFVKQNGTWKIKALHYYPRLLTDYDKGWAKDAQPAPGPSKDFPPDRPPTEVYEIFPKFYIPRFHFANPVTGLATQYPGGIGQATPGAPPSRRQGFPEVFAGETPALPARRPHMGKESLPELSQKIAETERLLNRAVAYDAAENLAGAYGYYLDEFMWDETADLFAVDGTRNLSSIGSNAGRERIRESLKRRYPGKKSADYLLAHQLVQPVIHVARDGQSTQMRVRLFQLGGPSGGNGFWIAGIYECTTGLENRVWKFKSMDLQYIWTADYKRGWAHIDKDAKGIITTPFPKIINLPFHYDNPVTGRKPH